MTKLLVGAGLVVLADSRTTQWLVTAPDPAFDYTIEQDTPAAWRRYVEGEGSRVKAQEQLGRLHQRAITTLRDRGAPRPDAIAPWLSVLRERVDERIVIDFERMTVDRESFAEHQARPDGSTRMVDITDTLPEHDYACGLGIGKAFTAALGAELFEIDFGTGTAPSDAPRIVMQWSTRATGGFYGGPTSTVVFPGIEVTASLQLVHQGSILTSVDATVEPGAGFEYSTFGPSFMLPPDPSDVVSGMVEAACTRLGERWIEEIVGMPPVVAVEHESIADRCKRGDTQACIDHGDELRSRDPAAALEAFETGCRRLGVAVGRSCLAAAELALERGDEEGLFRAETALQSGCDAHDARACTRAADVKLQRPLDPERRKEAYLLRLRACDLGDARGCIAAAIDAEQGVLGDEPSQMRAALLAGRGCAGAPPESCYAAAIGEIREAKVHGHAIGARDTGFAIHWGVWWPYNASEIVWFTSETSLASTEQRLGGAIAEGTARVYAPDAVPYGITAPAGAVTIYALASKPSMRMRDGSCPECTAEAAESMIWPVGCVCLPR